MPASQEVRNNIYNGWDFDESGWGVQNDVNLRKIATFLGLSVIDRDLTTPPVSPAEGDAYIVAATATDAWTGAEDSLVIWDGVAWVQYDPALGRSRLLCYVEDENRLVVWDGTDWSNGVNFS